MEANDKQCLKINILPHSLKVRIMCFLGFVCNSMAKDFFFVSSKYYLTTMGFTSLDTTTFLSFLSLLVQGSSPCFTSNYYLRCTTLLSDLLLRPTHILAAFKHNNEKAKTTITSTTFRTTY